MWYFKYYSYPDYRKRILFELIGLNEYIQVGAVFLFVKNDSQAAKVAVGITIAVILIILLLMGLFLFIWFIVVSIH